MTMIITTPINNDHQHLRDNAKMQFINCLPHGGGDNELPEIVNDRHFSICGYKHHPNYHEHSHHNYHENDHHTSHGNDRYSLHDGDHRKSHDPDHHNSHDNDHHNLCDSIYQEKSNTDHAAT